MITLFVLARCLSLATAAEVTLDYRVSLQAGWVVEKSVACSKTQCKLCVSRVKLMRNKRQLSVSIVSAT